MMRFYQVIHSFQDSPFMMANCYKIHKCKYIYNKGAIHKRRPPNVSKFDTPSPCPFEFTFGFPHSPLWISTSIVYNGSKLN